MRRKCITGSGAPYRASRALVPSLSGEGGKALNSLAIADF